MSRKESLTKKIAHTLLAMSIVYSSGINIVVNEVYAAEQTKNITDGDGSFTVNGTGGNSYYTAGGITSGEDVSITGKITDSSISSDISVTATGGKGGDDKLVSPTETSPDNKGGDAVARVTVDESLSSVTTGKITVTATGGTNGSAYQGVSKVAGAAAAYGLDIKHDLTITAAEISVEAASRFEYPYKGVEIGAAKHSDAVAVGLQVDNCTVTFTGADIKVNAKTSSNMYDVKEMPAGATQAAAGGNAVAYGIAVNGGIAHLDLQDISIKQSGSSNYISGGAGGNFANSTVQAGWAGRGGNGGNTDVAGIHIVSGKADGTARNIVIDADAFLAKGGSGGNVIDSISGSGGAGGDFYAAGISNAGGEAELTVDGMDIKATGGRGGDLGSLTVTDANKLSATGAVQAAAGKGGKALVVGVDNQGGSSKVTVTDTIKLVAIGGNGGTGSLGYSSDKMTDTLAQILVSERVSGTGGEAIAVGLQNTAGSLTAEVQKLEITATGGLGGVGISTYGTINGASAAGGAAAAYGINVLGGSAESLTVAEITVEAVGGSTYQPNQANDLIRVNDDGAGVVGGNGGKGGSGAAYGVSNSGGSAGLTVTKITAKASGGVGGEGGGVSKKDSGTTAAGTGGDGGNGGNAYAYGVLGQGSGSRTVIAVDQIIAEANAGIGGKGAVATNVWSGIATAGADGQKGAQAEAYGVYAEKGAVITLSAKTDGGNNGTITIGAKAGNTETAEGSKAYAIYADNATVLFNDNAVLNSDGTSTDDTVITYLNNATFGFGTPGEGQDVGRTITGGTLQLAGSNTFKIATDLNNNNADKFTFAKLAAGSSTATQYIAVGYDKAFDGSKLDSFVGDVTVLTVTNLEADQNLNNFVGKESEMDDPLTRFLATPTIEVGADGTGNGGVVKITQIDFAEAGASETVMTAADAQMSIANLWRVEGNNLMKRMGDLRSDDPEAAKGGVWARYYRGEMSADSAYDRSFDQDYTAFQGGIDKVQDYKGGKLYTGIAVNRIDSNAGYSSGSGDLSSTGVGLYASWLGSKGHYLDVIARGSKLANDFKLVDKSGREANADYDTWAYGISAEYGYRQQLDAGWFVEPQAELSLGRIGSADYTMSNGTQISQDAVNSAVTRIGVLSGKEFTMNGRQGNAYLKASLLHDFGGNGGGAAYYNGRSTVVESADMNGTWWELGLGANLGLAKNSNLYFDALKTFGGDLRTEWQFNAGLRFTF